MSARNHFGTADKVEKCLLAIADELGLRIEGFLDRNDLLIPITPGEIAAILPTMQLGITSFVLCKNPGLDVRISWYPPADPVLVLKPTYRIELTYNVGAGWGWNFAQQLFLTTISHISPHWGELMVRKATNYKVMRTVPGTNPPVEVEVPEVVTMCGLGGHETTVPHLASANYFGPEYYDYFGGLAKFQQAGFSRVDQFHEGVFVLLSQTPDPDEYRSKRQQVENMLEPYPGVFDPKTRSSVPVFRRD